MFRFNTSVHSYPTRISGNFHLTNPKLLLTHKSIRHSGPDIWNKFPDNIKSCTSVYSLKAALKRQIIQSYAPESITWNNAYYETIHVIVIFFLFKCTTAPCTHTCKCTAPTWSPNFLKRAMSPDFFFFYEAPSISSLTAHDGGLLRSIISHLLKITILIPDHICIFCICHVY